MSLVEIQEAANIALKNDVIPTDSGQCRLAVMILLQLAAQVDQIPPRAHFLP